MSESEATLVYDDDCGFCTWWADYFDERTALRIVGFSDLTDELRARLPDDYEACSHLVTDDAVYSCGASIEEALTRTDVGGPVDDVVEFLRQFEDYERFPSAATGGLRTTATAGAGISRRRRRRRGSDDR